MGLSADAPSCMPILAKVVSQDWANAVMSGAWPLPLPHTSPWSLCSTWLGCGHVSWVGESTLALIVVVGLCVSRAELVTILNVEPGGYAPSKPPVPSGSVRSLAHCVAGVVGCGA